MEIFKCGINLGKSCAFDFSIDYIFNQLVLAVNLSTASLFTLTNGRNGEEKTKNVGSWSINKSRIGNIKYRPWSKNMRKELRYRSRRATTLGRGFWWSTSKFIVDEIDR